MDAAKSTYHFVTSWRVRGTVEDVTDILRKGYALPRWWPAVYLDAQLIEPGNEQGLGEEVELHSKGWLPYTIIWRAKAVAVRHPFGYTIEATGDFAGHGTWTFEQDGEYVNVTYDWSVRATKPLLQHGARLFKPLYESNHRWAMKTGQRSLELELARRRANTPEERARIPAPPGPTTTSPVPLLLGFLAGAVAAVAALTWIAFKPLRATDGTPARKPRMGGQPR